MLMLNVVQEDAVGAGNAGRQGGQVLNRATEQELGEGFNGNPNLGNLPRAPASPVRPPAQAARGRPPPAAGIGRMPAQVELYSSHGKTTCSVRRNSMQLSSCCSSQGRSEGNLDMLSIFVTKIQLLCVQSAHLAVMTGTLASMLPAQLSLQLRFAYYNFFMHPASAEVLLSSAGLFAMTSNIKRAK